MTALRRFDQEISDLCNALGGRAPPMHRRAQPRLTGNQSRRQPMKERERMVKTGHRFERTKSEEEEDMNFPIHHDYKGTPPTSHPLADAPGGAGLGPDWQPLADRLQQSPPNW